MGFRIGINGLGRIGRGFLRLALGRPGVEVVAINDLAEPQVLAHLLRHDSLFGRAVSDIHAEAGAIRAGAGEPIRCTRVPRPSEIPWGDAGVDLVIESTGAFTSRAAAAGHLVSPGGRRVLITAPSPDADLTVCYGVNHLLYDSERHRVLSNASCTTNGMAVVLSVVEEAFGIDRVTMTTVHCYTNNQVLPALAGKVQALAVRVPVAAVSLLDFTILLRRPATIEAARAAFRQAAEGRLAGILGYEQEELVSIDFLGDSRSAVIDAPLLSLEGDRLLKVYAWYDNERGYVERLLDLIRHMGRPPAPGESRSPG